MSEKKPKILVIYGPTAIGKTKMGLRLAKRFNGEIVSADSRQVYQGMDIGTGKDVKNIKYQISNIKIIRREKYRLGFYCVEGVKIWLLDVAKPDQSFSVAEYTKLASEAITNITRRKKLPIIVGGTGFYIKALLEGVGTLGIEPDWELRRRLGVGDIKRLREELKKIDPKRWNQMNESDQNNPRRLVRAIEVAKRIKNTQTQMTQIAGRNFDSLFIGLKTSLENLYQRVDQRVEERIKMGAEEEVRGLINQGYTWELPAMSGMGYRQWKPYFEGLENKEAVIQKWKYAEHGYARRQLTWFKKALRQDFGELSRTAQGYWFDISERKWENEIEKLVSAWLAQKNAKKS